MASWPGSHFFGRMRHQLKVNTIEIVGVSGDLSLSRTSLCSRPSAKLTKTKFRSNVKIKEQTMSATKIIQKQYDNTTKMMLFQKYKKNMIGNCEIRMILTQIHENLIQKYGNITNYKTA